MRGGADRMSRVGACSDSGCARSPTLPSRAHAASVRRLTALVEPPSGIRASLLRSGATPGQSTLDVVDPITREGGQEDVALHPGVLPRRSARTIPRGLRSPALASRTISTHPPAARLNTPPSRSRGPGFRPRHPARAGRRTARLGGSIDRHRRLMRDRLRLAVRRLRG